MKNEHYQMIKRLDSEGRRLQADLTDILKKYRSLQARHANELKRMKNLTCPHCKMPVHKWDKNKFTPEEDEPHISNMH